MFHGQNAHNVLLPPVLSAITASLQLYIRRHCARDGHDLRLLPAKLPIHLVAQASPSGSCFGQCFHAFQAKADSIPAFVRAPLVAASLDS